MNQILVTEKLYITPELKRKKRMYKLICMLSIFMIIVLVSFYIYAEYDKSKNESISQEILADMTSIDGTEEDGDDDGSNDIWEIIIATAEEQKETEEDDTEETTYGTYTDSNGNEYDTIGTICIPSIDVEYPILSETTTALLKIAPCKFWGPEPNEVGNLCIAGHNYKTDQFFSNVPDLVIGDVIEITDLSGRTLKYSVYDKYTVVPEDTSCTTQETDGKKIVTLITCTDDNAKRVIVQAKEIT